MTDTLTGKQRRFIDEYFACGMNATEAARRAGYSEDSAHVIAHENLRKPNIRAEVERRFKERTLSADEVLARLTEQARGDVVDILKDDGTLDFEKAKAGGKTALIKKISQRTIITDNSESHTVEVELYGAQKALEILGKYHALWTERVEHSGTEGKPPIRFTWDDMDGGDNSGHGE
jgi:phage terminase small subunit